jgi:hypothetical protein
MIKQALWRYAVARLGEDRVEELYREAKLGELPDDENGRRRGVERVAMIDAEEQK